MDDSYATPHYRVLEKYFWHYGATVQIVVNQAPDLRIPFEREIIHDMTKSFANTKHSIGEKAVEIRAPAPVKSRQQNSLLPKLFVA